ncbi:MAG: hypothetical protein CFH22_00436 [Alphaproteobacteria bacterium MarineAlpha5_Bin12]|nr:protein translocase subunit SecD [Pelagibacteraceae bacterium]PPR41889.1 MAG: hypothetical protein CFH22_00436 [Alphaproteobacteria bacterium MarineAlpha5_Bin12]|tara:strand:+ start:4010 stop:5566 length:1557 start_codon:yes stop_codon:yes gene_type:complete
MKNYSLWRLSFILVIIISAITFSIPTLFYNSNNENWFFEKKVNLGLDLQGGSHLLLEVKNEILLKEEINNISDFVRKFSREERITLISLEIKTDELLIETSNKLDTDKLVEFKNKNYPRLNITRNDNNLVFKISDSHKKNLFESAINQSLEIVRKRIDESGTKEPLIQRQGIDRILLQLPGIKDPARIKNLLGKTAKLTFHMVDDENLIDLDNSSPPPGKMIIKDNLDENIKYLVEVRIRVGGENLVDAQPTYEQGSPAVSFRFNPLGARKFGKATSSNVGKRFAVILDNRVITAPVIRSAITDGNGVITGNFTIQEAQDLSLLLRAGALPAPIEIIEERSVGPGLGADSINAGKIASITGLILVGIFMFLTYGILGFIANISLITNLFIIISSLSLIGVTLTLPGIAGIVLTIGMAVDANVLIFERIKEEINRSNHLITAINNGFKKAISTIIDANLTTLIAALLLFIFGSGPIKGFAVTLSLGIVASMFTAILLTNLLTLIWYNSTKPKKIMGFNV